MKRSLVMKWITAMIVALIMLNVTATEPIHTSDKKEASGIDFYTGSWEEALQQAKMEGKPIFLDISASWCGPCKMLKANTFSNMKVGEYYNTHFINVAVDGEEGEGIQLASKYRTPILGISISIKSFPVFIF